MDETDTPPPSDDISLDDGSLDDGSLDDGSLDDGSSVQSEDGDGFGFLADADSENHVADADGYQVLARKYRPQSFADLIGQEAMVQTLHNAFTSGRIAHAFMLTGVRGIGKTTTARILARALNYHSDQNDQPSLDLSQEGTHCRAIMEGRHVDVIEIDAASNTGIDNIRELIEQVRYLPSSARFKVYIIDEVHMLSRQAFNGLLKTLEEPPVYVKFIFATTEIRKVPVTILSRCQRFDLRRLTSADTVTLLQKVLAAEQQEVGEDALALIARVAEGSARDALSLLDRALAHAGGDKDALTSTMMREMLGLSDRGRIFDLFDLLMKGEMAETLNEFDAQYRAGAEGLTIIGDLAALTHWLTRLKYVADAEADLTISEDQRKRGKKAAEELSVQALARIWQALLKGYQEVVQAPDPKAASEMVLIRIAHMADMPTPDELIKQYETTSSSQISGGQASPQATSEQGASQTPAQQTPLQQTSAPQAHSSGAAPQPVAQPIEMTEAAPENPPETIIRNFADIVALAATHNEKGLQYALETGVHLVSFKPGHIEMRLRDGQENIAQTLTRKLREWTGRQWVISLAQTGGEETLHAQAQAARDIEQQNVLQDPLVAAAMKTFPNTEIVAITELGAADLSPIEEDD